MTPWVNEMPRSDGKDLRSSEIKLNWEHICWRSGQRLGSGICKLIVDAGLAEWDSHQDVSSPCQAAASTPAAAQPVQAAPVATGSEGEKLFAELKALDADSSKERCVWKVPDL